METAAGVLDTLSLSPWIWTLFMQYAYRKSIVSVWQAARAVNGIGCLIHTRTVRLKRDVYAHEQNEIVSPIVV